MGLFWGGDVEIGVGNFDENEHTGTPWIGYLILAICVSLSAYFIYLDFAANRRVFLFGGEYSFFVNPTEKFDFIKLSGKAIASLFVQGNLFTIAICLFYFCVFQDNVEYAMGRLRFIFFYLIAGYLTLWITYLIVRPLEMPLSGFTASLAAIIGAYARIFPRVKFNLYRDNGVFDRGSIFAVFVPFTRVRWAQVSVFTYVFFWFTISFVFSWLSTALNHGSTIACFQAVGLVVGYCLADIFRDPNIAILDQDAPGYKEHLEYASGKTKIYSSKTQHFTFYNKNAIDPTFSAPPVIKDNTDLTK